MDEHELVAQAAGQHTGTWSGKRDVVNSTPALVARLSLSGESDPKYRVRVGVRSAKGRVRHGA
jgi:hypothetical protein